MTNLETFTYDLSSNIIKEKDKNGTDKVLKQYIYGNNIDEILRMDIYSTTTNNIEKSYYYHTDRIGNIKNITDSTGKIIESYSYDLYGMPQIYNDTGEPINESAIGNNYLFQGRRFDSELKLYYYRARAYDPETGRFLQTDPIGYRDSMNIYQAFNMNGWNYTDPWGLFWVILENGEPEFPSSKNNWELTLYTTFKIEFNSYTDIAKKVARFLGEEIVEYIIGKKYRIVENLLKLKDIKELMDFVEFAFGDLSIQEASISNPLSGGRLKKESLVKYIKYRIIEAKTDTILKKIYEEYCRKIGKNILTTEETITFLKKARNKLRNIFREEYSELNANTFYPWEALLYISLNTKLREKGFLFTNVSSHRANVQINRLKGKDREIAIDNWKRKYSSYGEEEIKNEKKIHNKNIHSNLNNCQHEIIKSKEFSTY